MSPELAAIRELETQRNDLLAGLALAAAYEKMASRAAEAVFAAAKAEAKAAALEAKVADLTKPGPEAEG